MTTRRKSESQSSANVHILQDRVKELEGEVSSLKKRLDELRKAKNTTIIKRDTQVIAMNAPNLGRRVSKSGDSEVTQVESGSSGADINCDSQVGVLMKRLEDSERDRKKDKEDFEEQLKTLKEQHEKEIKWLNEEMKKLTSAKTESEEMKVIRKENQKLTRDSNLLREKIEMLYTELSCKEAQWCEREEKLKSQMRVQWGEHYAQWMEGMEMKMQELQGVNTYLRSQMEQNRGSNRTGDNDR